MFTVNLAARLNNDGVAPLRQMERYDVMDSQESTDPSSNP